jgi:phosphomannomutase
MRISDLKISISGIRGIVGRSLTPQLVIRFVEAFATYIGGGPIAVASDTRPSREMVKQAVFAGLLSGGASPTDLGILPIPSLQIYVRDRKLAGGICITASHNPIDWNALKLVKHGGYFLNPYEAGELLDLYYQGKFRRVATPERIRVEDSPFLPHRRRILEFIDVERIRKARLRVVVDPCGGAAAPYVRDFLSELGAEVHCINCDITGNFPRNPEPLPDHIGELCRAVIEKKADIGFAQDADADRLAVVDEKGRPLGEEYTLGLAVEHFLNTRGPSPVVVNLSTSRQIADIADRHGVPIFRTRVGEINVARRMLKVEARIGGEGNGGVIAAGVHACRDSFTGMALVLESLALSGRSVSRLRSGLPDYVMIKDKFPVTFRDQKRILNRLQERFPGARIDKRDGLKLDFPDGWLHVRPSNTEPVLRVFAEAPDEKTARRLFNQAREEF